MKFINWAKRVKLVFGKPTIVLMYHRVFQQQNDPWLLSVSPNNFEEHLKVLSKTRMVAPLSSLYDELYSIKKAKATIIITFDDGYADNYLFAKPLLEKYNLPATFFITTNHIGKEIEFWWDELEKIILKTSELPESLNLMIRGVELSFDLKEERTLTEELVAKYKSWNAYQSTSTRRCTLYLELWKLISPLQYEEQQFIMDKLRKWSKNSDPRKENFSMTAQQLIELQKNPLFTIGAHTESHPTLSCFPIEYQEKEIINSKLYLEKLTGSSVNSFAYPSGNFNELTYNILRNNHFQLAFTTQGHSLTSNPNQYLIGRFQVNNWGKKEFTQNLYHFWNS